MDYEGKYQSKPKSFKYFATDKYEYQSPKRERHPDLQNHPFNTQNSYKDLEKSTYSNKFDSYEEEILAKKNNHSSILRNTTYARPLKECNRDIDVKSEYDRKYDKKNVTIAEHISKSKHYDEKSPSQSYITQKNDRYNGLNTYLSHKEFPSIQHEQSPKVSPFKRKNEVIQRVQSKNDIFQRSKMIDQEIIQNEKSRKKLLERYQQFIGSKSAKQLDSSQYIQRSTYEINDYKKDYKPYDPKYQHSIPTYGNKNNVPKSLKDLSPVKHREDRQEYNRLQEFIPNQRFSKKKNELDGVRSLERSKYDVEKSKSPPFLSSNTLSSKSYADLPRYQSSKTCVMKQPILQNHSEKTRISIFDFNIGKSKGEGKFGTVYAAVHKVTGSLYALKKISKQMIRSHLMENQLALEIRLQLFFNHPNILKLYGFFDDKQHIYLILEYMQQGTLFESLKKRTDRMPEKEVIQRIRQMSMAIKYIHQLDVAHRDIKPQNIVISNGISKLCDFGWATRCTDRRKTYCGTFDYAAPEILEGKQYDWCVDLWCLGVLTFELLVGKVPFYHISRKQTMKKILRVDRDQIVFPNDISWKAKDFIQCLIKKDPQQRTTSDKLLQHPFLKEEKDTKI